jgi:hypothetical protein
MADTRALIKPSILGARLYGDALDELAAELETAGLDAEVRQGAEDKFLDPDVVDFVVQLIGALKDEAVGATATAIVSWFARVGRKKIGKRGDGGSAKRIVQILGPNGQILREVEVDDSPASE